MRISDWSSDVCSSDLPVPPVVVTSIKPFEGPDPTQGNADIRGPGTGVGGIGDGTGSGGRGDGGGAGGNSPPRHTGGRIRNSDYPASAGTAGAGGVVSVEYYVLPSGRVPHCHLTQSNGTPGLDGNACRLTTQTQRHKTED